MSQWRCTYQGKPDSLSAAGCAQPSWHTFDKRVWKKGDYTITLRNLNNEGDPRAPGKIATYRVELRFLARLIETQRGHDWQKLVREMKESVK